MSHKLANFFETQGYFDEPLTYRVSTHDYGSAINALIEDTDAFLLNGIISLGAAINSLNRSNFSKMNFSDNKGPIAPLILKITDLALPPY